MLLFLGTSLLRLARNDLPVSDAGGVLLAFVDGGGPKVLARGDVASDFVEGGAAYAFARRGTSGSPTLSGLA